MLSVLVPIYNFDVREMIQDLHSQLMQSNVPFEIRCYDDGSKEQFKKDNRSLMSLPHILYQELNKNIGRSAIRNKLARDAVHEYILFLDADGRLPSEEFVSGYLENLSTGTVVYGGRSYSDDPPIDRKKYLRWFYGTKREVVPYHERQIHPYRSFMTNNFAMPRILFLSIGLNEEIKGYGHEDTLLGMELRKNKIPIKHIDNPLCHIGLEDAEEFLSKTEEGVKNLYFLVESGLLPGKEVKLWSTYSMVRRIRLEKFTYKQYLKRKPGILDNLLGENPTLKNFDFYKLGILLSCYLEK